MPKNKKQSKQLYIILAVILLAIIIVLSTASDREADTDKIRNFEECISAGYPVMESYPRQCRTADGTTFTEIIPSTEPAEDAPEEPSHEPEEDFCGRSTKGRCLTDSDCTTGGCSGQVCQSKDEERMITTCEYRECYNAEAYGMQCKCVNEQCQWYRYPKE